MDFSQGKRILTAFFNRAMPIFVLLAVALNLSAGSVGAEDENPELAARGYAANALETQIVLKGEDILAGQGVAVIYPLQGPFNSSGYLPFQYQCTAAGCFQCLEFILWLYDARLGYPYKWPGAFWNPYEMIGVIQIADQLAYKVETRLLSPTNTQYLLYKEYTDLDYFPNGSAAPPAPGDILISADGAHAMIVNRVGGDQIEVVQQNNWEIKPDPLPLPLENRQLYFDGFVYTVQNSMGWIHSPRWAALLAQSADVPADGEESLQWARGAQSLTLTISTEMLNELAAGAQNGAPRRMAEQLAAAGALALTNPDYLACVLNRLAELLPAQPALQPANGVTSLAVEIPYVHGPLRITPSGGPQSGAAADYNLPACTWDG
ncbi:MAG: hypothetical protein HPY72_03720 [Anaerolineae bacterium]|nr:hypothetical protein [Anaerolineae bacterium]